MTTVHPTGDRALASAILITVAIGGVLVLALIGLAVPTLTGLVAGAGWISPRGYLWQGLWLLLNADQPGSDTDGPAAAVCSRHATLFLLITLAVVAVYTIVATIGGYACYRHVWPMPAGHATRRQLHAELSPAAARRTAQWTRPALTPRQRRHCPVTDLALPHHQLLTGLPLWLPLENHVGCLAPTQTAKSRTELIHKAHAAPGALLCSTTKTDLLEWTALARTRRAGAGPVMCLDVTGTARWPATIHWSPIPGCDDPRPAFRRAESMVASSVANLNTRNLGNDPVFQQRAAVVLQAYLLASALTHRDVDALARWATSRSTDPVDILLPRYPDLARNLRSEITMVAETADAVWLSVRRAVAPLFDPHVKALCTPGAGQQFDIASFIQARGSLYVIAGEDSAATATPILTAFADQWLAAVQDMALSTEHRRLDPVVLTLLDEVSQATPVPQLPARMADLAGRGGLVCWAAQSLAGLNNSFQEQGTRRLLDNTTTVTVHGGLKDEEALQWLSTLTGTYERRRYQQHSDGMLRPSRTTVGMETVPTYRPADIRMIPRGQALVIHRHLPPIRVRSVDVARRPDWPAIRADVEAIRAGEIAVDHSGYRTDQEQTP